MINRWSTLLLLPLLLTTAFGTQTAHAADAGEIKLEGSVFVESVDARRIVVAIETNRDGLVTDFFTYTSRTPIPLAVNWRRIRGTLRYQDGQQLVIQPDIQGHLNRRSITFIVVGDVKDPNLDPLAIVFKDGVGLHHYLPSTLVHTSQLRGMKLIADCDTSPNACVRIANQLIPFAG